MITLNSEGGFEFSDPGDDVIRDTFGLILAILRLDEDGQQAILDNADLRGLAFTCAAIAAACVTATVRRDETDLDTPPAALTGEQLQHAQAFLAMAFTRPGDPDHHPGDL